MLTRFFSNSKPINFLVTIVLITAIVFANLLLIEKPELTLVGLGYWVLIWLGFIFSMFLVDFISRKNDLTKNTTYKIILFTLFLGAFPNTFLTTELFWANLFILLALRRIISLRTKKDTFKKVFDAALWIGVASLFWFWSVVFFAVLYVGIFYYRKHAYKEFIIPVAALGTVFTLTTVYYLLFENTFFNPVERYAIVGFDFSTYLESSLLTTSTTVAVVFVTALIFNFFHQKGGKKSRKKNRLLFITTLASLAVVFLAPQKNGSEMIFFALPFSVIVSNFIETSKILMLKEVILWVMVVLSVFNLI